MPTNGCHRQYICSVVFGTRNKEKSNLKTENQFSGCLLRPQSSLKGRRRFVEHSPPDFPAAAAALPPFSGCPIGLPRPVPAAFCLRTTMTAFFCAAGLPAAAAEPVMPALGSTSSAVIWISLLLLLVIPSTIVLAMPQNRLRRTLINWLLWFFGAVFLLLGIIGAFLPIMPTTPFVLVTAACWGRASPRFHRWLHQHRFFGPMVQNWEQRRAVPRRAKYLAWSMMTLSCSWLFFQFPQRWYVGAGTSAVCLCVALWMARLPDA